MKSRKVIRRKPGELGKIPRHPIRKRRPQPKQNRALMASGHALRDQRAGNAGIGLGPAVDAADGDQRRDFIHVDDVVRVNLHFLDRPVSGVFNCGTGRAQPFNDIAVTVVNTLREREGLAALSLAQMVAQGLVRYAPFPDALKGKYQSYTQADLSNLRAAGYTGSFYSVEEGVARYVGRLIKKYQK